jgi:hypothetical protein
VTLLFAPTRESKGYLRRKIVNDPHSAPNVASAMYAEMGRSGWSARTAIWLITGKIKVLRGRRREALALFAECQRDHACFSDNDCEARMAARSGQSRVTWTNALMTAGFGRLTHIDHHPWRLSIRS